MLQTLLLPASGLAAFDTRYSPKEDCIETFLFSICTTILSISGYRMFLVGRQTLTQA
ncbi:uncharacterized protein CCOS01_02062 [Colletotrichum costaricense]|uniref:Uncharacterized protein n=1 Tax=Colletotrichum costaricense TaxID=1209916 RepID=A0AAI9Z6Y3_9PEZI|nr:uncharacterized protein CCOS01_02062 [Colletotrichum costaricense]KAK1536742.1 hypothetical protein CCOS01_02062 [Colletotrichum costaricense]